MAPPRKYPRGVVATAGGEGYSSSAGPAERPERCIFSRDDFLSARDFAQHCGNFIGFHKSPHLSPFIIMVRSARQGKATIAQRDPDFGQLEDLDATLEDVAEEQVA